MNPNSKPAEPTETRLRAQVKRLAAYHGYDNLKHELLRVLKTDAVSDEHAQRIVTHMLDTRRPNENGFISCPTPAELIDCAGQVPARLNQRKEADKNCTICGGSGWRIIERKGMSGADRCACTLIS